MRVRGSDTYMTRARRSAERESSSSSGNWRSVVSEMVRAIESAALGLSTSRAVSTRGTVTLR